MTKPSKPLSKAEQTWFFFCSRIRPCPWPMKSKEMALRAEPVRHQPTTVETARKSNGNGTEKESKRNGRKIIFLLTYRKRIRRYRCGGRHRRIHFETSRDRFVLLRPILFCFFFGICLTRNVGQGTNVRLNRDRKSRRRCRCKSPQAAPQPTNHNRRLGCGARFPNPRKSSETQHTHTHTQTKKTLEIHDRNLIKIQSKLNKTSLRPK